MSGLLSKAKDQAINAMARQILGGKIKRYGELQSLRIDTSKRSILLRLKPAGEPEPIELEVLRYEIRAADDGESAIAVLDARSDRLWLQNVLEDVVIGREFPLPKSFGGLIGSLLQ